MTIAQVCSRQVVTVDRAAPLAEAARLMRDHHVGALVVTAGTEHGPGVVGVVTDRDLVVEAVARGIDIGDIRVGQLVRGPVVVVAENAELGEALEKMQAHGVRRLLVTDAQGHLAGVVSFDDVVPVLATQLIALAKALRISREREAAERPALASPPLPRLRLPEFGTAGWSGP